MEMKRSNLILVGLSIITILLIAYWIVASEKSSSKPSTENQTAANGASSNQTHQLHPAQAVIKTNTMPVALPVFGITSSPTNSQRISEPIALDSLKRWIKRRDGKEVVIVDAQQVNDLPGNPVSLNVLVTSKAGGLSAADLKTQLADMAKREHVLKDQLHDSYQKTDIATVNQLVAEFSQARTAFVATNEVVAYKISLSKERPPVLSYWEGLSFETVREEDARRLAAIKLGDDLGLQGYVHYTSAASLLCFTNGAGSRVFIDPYQLAEVPLAALQLPRGGAQRADAGREARIATQWEDFLNQ